jgi:hypothetical protein
MFRRNKNFSEVSMTCFYFFNDYHMYRQIHQILNIFNTCKMSKVYVISRCHFSVNKKLFHSKCLALPNFPCLGEVVQVLSHNRTLDTHFTWLPCYYCSVHFWQKLLKNFSGTYRILVSYTEWCFCCSQLKILHSSVLVLWRPGYLGVTWTSAPNVLGLRPAESSVDFFTCLPNPSALTDLKLCECWVYQMPTTVVLICIRL